MQSISKKNYLLNQSLLKVKKHLYLHLTHLTLSLILIIPTCTTAQNVCFNYMGSWSDWSPTYGEIKKYSNENGYLLDMHGIKYFSFQITSFFSPTKKELKEHLKTKEWFEVDGIVEYYVNDKYPTAKDVAKRSFFVIPNPRVDKTPNARRSTSATIKIAPYKHKPEIYNIWFDGIGIGLDVRGLKFEGDQPNKGRRNRRLIANIAQSIFLFPIGIGSWWWNPINE